MVRAYHHKLREGMNILGPRTSLEIRVLEIMGSKTNRMATIGVYNNGDLSRKLELSKEKGLVKIEDGFFLGILPSYINRDGKIIRRHGSKSVTIHYDARHRYHFDVINLKDY